MSNHGEGEENDHTSHIQVIVGEPIHQETYVQPRLGRTVHKTIYPVTHNIEPGRGFRMEDVDNEINEMFRAIVEDAFKRVGSANKRVSIELNAGTFDPGEEERNVFEEERLRRKMNKPDPLFMGYFKKNDYDHRIFMSRMSNISQSESSSFFLSKNITVKVAVISSLRIGTRNLGSNAGSIDVTKHFESKCKTVFQVKPPGDRTCGFWALALGLKYHTLTATNGKLGCNAAKWIQYRKNSNNILEHAVRDLCSNVGLSYNENMCDFDDVRKIDLYLQLNHNICVICVERPYAGIHPQTVPPPLYPTPFEVDGKMKVIGLEFISGTPDGHVNLITSFTSYFSKDFFAPNVGVLIRMGRKNTYVGVIALVAETFSLASRI